MGRSVQGLRWRDCNTEGKNARVAKEEPPVPQATAFVLTHRSNDDAASYSASFQALAIMRSLGRRGVPVVRVHPGSHELSLRSRYCSHVEKCPNVHESEPALLGFLMYLAHVYPGRRVLFPASDDTAYFLGRYRDTLSTAYEVVAPGREAVETIVDKRRQYQAAQKLGIRIPETHFPADLAEVRQLAATLSGYPYIIKPNVAHRWRLSSFRDRMDTRGFKAILVRNAGELVEHYRRVAGVDPELMVQRVVHGEDRRLYGFFGCFDERSRPLGYCVRSKIRQLPVDFGYCTLIESCEEPDVVEQSIRLLQGLRYRGIVGVEWKLDPHTGERVLLEINARATNTSALPPACGVDLPWLAFADAIGRACVPVTRWRTGVKWLWFSADVWAARALGVGFLEWLKSLRGAGAWPVYAADDLAPLFLHLAVSLKADLQARLRRLRVRLSGAGARVRAQLRASRRYKPIKGGQA